MKAKQLAKILLQNPEAEIIIDQYVGANVLVSVNEAKLFKKGSNVKHIDYSRTDVVDKTGKCKVDVIHITSGE